MSCKMCNLCLPTQVAGRGPANAKLIIVGDNPNKDDETSGFPFTVGKNPNREYPATIIYKILRGFGYDPSTDVFFTNAVRCNPFHRSKTIDVKPTHLTACRTHNLDPELTQVAAPVILALGPDALGSLCPELKGGVAKNRGSWHVSSIGGKPRLVRVSFPLSRVAAQSCWEAMEDESGDLFKGKRDNMPGTISDFFLRDIVAVDLKLKELGLGPVISP